MQMVAHQAEGMHPVANTHYAFGQEFIEVCTVSGDHEHVLASVTPQDHVVKTTGLMQSGFAGHEPMLRESRHYAVYQA